MEHNFGMIIPNPVPAKTRMRISSWVNHGLCQTQGTDGETTGFRSIEFTGSPGGIEDRIDDLARTKEDDIVIA